MKPRVLYRTHYQVDEPAFVELLVAKCTSPVRSNYREQVAEQIAREIRSRGRSFNAAAGAYAIDLAHGLGVLTTQHAWDGNGHLINLVARVGEHELDQELPLTEAERLLHFRLFFEADGAALLFLARALLNDGSLPASDDSWNSLAQDMFVTIYSEYLSLASITQDRVALRQDLARLQARGFAGKTGAHKLFIHLQTLYRLGLAELEETGGRRRYKLNEAARGRLERLVHDIQNLAALEEVFKRQRWIELAAPLLVPGSTAKSTEEWRPDDVVRLATPHYQRVVATGVALCPLRPLLEAVQIELLAHESVILPSETATEMIRAAQRASPRKIRFHVDRQGKPAFVILDKAILEEFNPAAPS